MGKWDRYYMNFAKLAADMSKDTTKVGAVLVGPKGEIRLTGYNGAPKGVADHPDRYQRPIKYLYVSHAEQNVVAFAARQGICTDGCTLFTTHFPCTSCAKSIIQAGIKEVVFETDVLPPGSPLQEEFGTSRQMFEEAGVNVRMST